MNGVADLSGKCKKRDFLDSFFSGYVVYGGGQIDFGKTDLAVIEKVMNAIEQEKNLLVKNPFSYPILPVLISYAYMFASEDGLSSNMADDLPMLLLPNEGYIGDFGEFYYENGTELQKVMSKENISSLSGLQQEHKIYRATSTDVLRSKNSYYKEIGMVFCDLRKDVWKDNFELFERFIQKNNVHSVIMYTDESDYGFELGDKIADEVIEINGSMMAGEGEEEVGRNPTRSRIQESILSTPVEVQYVSVNPEQYLNLYIKLLKDKNRLSQSDSGLGAVNKLFNLLTGLPVKPETYDDFSRKNWYYPSIESLLSSIKSEADRAEGLTSEVLQDFYYNANDLVELLNESSPKENALTTLAEMSSENDKEISFIAKNLAHKKAVEKTLLKKGIELENEILLRKDVEPSLYTEFVFLTIPWRESSIYEFPPSNSLSFLVYPFEKNLVESPLKDRCSTELSEKRFDVEGTFEAVEFQADDIQKKTAEVIMAQNPSKESSSTSENKSVNSIQIDFNNGECLEIPQNRILTVFDEDKNTIVRKKVLDIHGGEKVLLISGAKESLYSLLIDQEHQRKEIKQKEELIEKWRDILREGVESPGWSSEKVLEELKERGSGLKTRIAVENWISGDSLGPQDPQDVRRVLNIFAPAYEDTFETIYDAMQYIRVEHRKLARQVRTIIEAKVDPSRSVKTSDIDQDKLKRIRDEINIRTVADGF